MEKAGVVFHPLDVTDYESVQDFVQFIKSTYGRVDVLVNAAGYGSFGALEEVTLDEARRQLDVNLFGIVDLIQQVTPIMRTQHSGRIINISSLAGQSYSALAGWYYISKHALETMSDVLRLELKPFGIDVVIVEPGITKTNWAKVTNEQMLKVTPKTSPYRKAAEKQANMITQATQTVAQVAGVIFKAATVDKPKVRYQVTRQDKIAMKGARLMPYKVLDKVAERMLKV